ncbi:hypothetical protein PROPHIGD91-2_43 [Mycobacterium phage prophiGD91-2]|uniref:hypothetical protein n=1 Tax=Mycobacteroides abscessus TaxID=36809 RepID=UPI000926E26E|nr:hypothetical protein [Mycobacteroides abscessus]QSM03898.1 hypothetical protein PROPHIGD91-2_43 [Mycobacterium phage prophiGD91-2]QSM90792.1 hypothetical protein I3U44_09145 [Mycobacteroides abscessus subsp. bolletii]SIJ02029.1 Uncharacterised protein [Mycobacteroides abscessus subsp. bolletii]SLD37235.1 Uncharacterised protein [Mycobacteroides abscessus subsp. bolletii]
MSDEPSDAQKLIAEVVAKHSGPYRTREHPFDAKRLYHCNYGCDWYGPNTTAFAEHVAAEVDKALGGLKREIRGRRGVTTHVRFASGWTVTE